MVRQEPIRRMGLLAGLLWLAVLLAGATGARGQESKPAPAAEPTTENEKQDAVPVPVEAGTRLMLKDGTFHVVRSYEMKGDRVRYYSVERSAWEEIPSAIVDWEATHRGEAEAVEKRKEIDERLRAIESRKTAAEIDADASLEVAPGVFLPDDIGLFIVEGSKVLAMTQSAAQSKLSKGRFLAQVMTPIPVVPSKHNVQLPGTRAALRLTEAQPEFYMRTGDAREPQVELIRARVKGKLREIASISTMFTGQSSESHNGISIERWQTARGVYRFTLSQKLEPGEYAFAEFMPQEGINLYVWDFGVDPAASPSPKK